jgi:hypothetical protein
VELLEELTEGMPRPNVLVVGLGEIGADVCRNLAEKRNFAVTLTNRTPAKADALAAEHNLPVLPFDEVWQAMPRFDVVICSVAKDEPFITKAAVQQMNICPTNTSSTCRCPAAWRLPWTSCPGRWCTTSTTSRPRLPPPCNAAWPPCPR